MTSIFSITTPANSAPVAASTGLGVIVFTVTNTTGRQLRARARLVAEDTAVQSWFGLVADEPLKDNAPDGPPGGDPSAIVPAPAPLVAAPRLTEIERDFPVGGVQTFTARIEVPPGAAPGPRRARLDVWDVDDPSETLTPGPTVAFDVSEVAPQVIVPRHGDGYLASLLGALGGGLIGATVLGFLGALAGQAAVPRSTGLGRPPILRPTPTPVPGGLGGIVAGAIGTAIAAAFVIAIAIVFGIVAGLWLGAIAGTWLALRLRQHRGGLATALLVAVILPVLLTIFLRLLTALFGAESLPTFIGIVLGLVCSPLAARAIVVWRQTGHLRSTAASPA